MHLITDQSIRRRIRSVLKTYLKKYSDVSAKRLTLGDLDTMAGLLRSDRKEAQKKSKTALKKELSISYLSIVTLAVGSLAVNRRHPQKTAIRLDWIDGANPNWIIGSFLLQATNYSLAIVRLVEDGLDNPARCVLRALSEMCAQILVLSSDATQLSKYSKAITPKDAKQTWYELFAKKGRLAKDLRKLEEKFGLAHSVSLDFFGFREDLNLIHSQAVHHSFVSTVILAYAGDFRNKERAYLSLFGAASSASRETLEHLNTLLFYTLLMFRRILVTVHGFKAPLDSRAWTSFYTLIECVEKVGTAKASWRRSKRSNHLREENAN